MICETGGAEVSVGPGERLTATGSGKQAAARVTWSRGVVTDQGSRYRQGQGRRPVYDAGRTKAEGDSPTQGGG